MFCCIYVCGGIVSVVTCKSTLCSSTSVSRSVSVSLNNTQQETWEEYLQAFAEEALNGNENGVGFNKQWYVSNSHIKPTELTDVVIHMRRFFCKGPKLVLHGL